MGVDFLRNPADATRADLHAAGKFASGFEAIELAAPSRNASLAKIGE
ncbi:hypothetical protein [Bradyrhizobium elkanii]|nr:hypothetical protein [Bradyrhizobium elkanii]